MEKKSIRKRTFLTELQNLYSQITTIEFKPAFILISVAVITVITYYFAGKSFFKAHFAGMFLTRTELIYWSNIYRLMMRFVVQFLLPIVLIKIILRERIRDNGVTIGDWRMGLKISILFIIIMVPIIWFVSAFDSFAQTYPQCPMVHENWKLFIIFEICYIFYMIGWEYIWRGYMLFGLKNKFGYYSILIQMIPFTILHFDKPCIESLSAVIAGLALGILAWRTNSFWYCALTHASVIIFMNLMAVLRYRTDVYGIGISSLIEMLGKIL